jgi:hypothetical protein
MNRVIALTMALGFALQPTLLLAQTLGAPETDTRLYLADGTIVMGKLIEQTDDLFIMQVEREIFTFKREEVDKKITLESLGTQAHSVKVREFPYVSFLGGTVAFGLLALLQFDTASDRDKEADLNKDNNLHGRAKSLRDKADRAKVLGWSSAVLAVSTMGVALYPKTTTKRVFPELTLESGEPTLHLTYRHSF